MRRVVLVLLVLLLPGCLPNVHTFNPEPKPCPPGFVTVERWKLDTKHGSWAYIPADPDCYLPGQVPPADQ